MLLNSKNLCEFWYIVDLIAVELHSVRKGIPLLDIPVYLADKKIRYI